MRRANLLFTILFLALYGCQTTPTTDATPPSTSSNSTPSQTHHCPPQRGLARVPIECQNPAPTATPQTTQVQPDTTTTPDKKQEVTLAFTDQKSFDTTLSTLLDQHAKTQNAILVTANFAEKAIPERINKWLSAVKEYEGKVDIESDSRSFIVIAGFLALLSQYVQHVERRILYAPAKHYNATMHVNSGHVTKIVFSAKQ